MCGELESRPCSLAQSLCVSHHHAKFTNNKNNKGDNVLEKVLMPMLAPLHISRIFVLGFAVFIAGCSGSSAPTADQREMGDPVVDPVLDPVANPVVIPVVNSDDQFVPTVRLSEDKTLAVGESITLESTVILQGMPIAAPSVFWEVLSGPGMAVLSDVTSREPQLTVDTAGQYVVKMAAFNGPYVDFDTQIITATPAVTNNPPMVNVGRNTSATVGLALDLTGEVEDDDVQGMLQIQWEKLSGPGNVDFMSANTPITSVVFDEDGTYILVLVANDGEHEVTDRIQIVVSVEPSSDGDVGGSWKTVSSSNGSKPTARHEAGGVGYNNQFYLIGGRGKRPVDRFNPSTKRWENLGTPSKEMHHFQPVALNGKIYVIGALECCFPAEKVVPKIQIFDPKTRKWTEGASLPKNRLRGSAGVVVYQGKIYMVGGTTNGHDGGTVNWFDEYNPATKQWKTLKNAPTKRDHFSAVIIGNRLIAAGGRQTAYPDTFSNLVGKVDVYNFKTQKWESDIPNIPTQRAGAVVTAVGDEVLVIGGETAKAGPAKDTVEAYNVLSRKWRSLNSIKQARHSGGIAKIDNAIHLASGNTRRGGGAETTSHEKLDLK